MKYFILLILLTSSLLSAYEWNPICTQDIEIYDLSQHYFGYPFVLACEDGLLVENGEEWIQINSGLPVLNLLHYSDHEFLLVQGNGTDSDGVYIFNENTLEFEVVEWIYSPNFLVFNLTDQEYYIGAYNGLYKSNDGVVWEEIAYFTDMNCEDIVFWENHYAVSVSGNIVGIHYSDDHGQTWSAPTSDCPFITDMSFRNDSKLFGVFPDSLDSSGLWSSMDFGYTWQNEFYSESLSCVNNDMNGYTFVGWEESNGVAKWSDATLIPLNEGLQNQSINNLFVNPIMSIIHVMAFTNQGAYMLSDYQTFSENGLISPEITLSNHPNPFNPSTTISFELNAEINEFTKLMIYNLKGQIVRTFSNFPITQSPYQQIVWNGTDQSNNPVSSGIYYYKLNIPNSPVKKMILLK